MRVVFLLFVFVAVLFSEENITATQTNQTTPTSKPTIGAIGSTKIFDTDKLHTYIGTSAIPKGTSGIIVHSYPNGDKVIVANASVVSVADGKSKLQLQKFEILKNNSVATTRQLPSDGDIFVPRHLYNNAIIIAPNMQTHKLIKESFFGVHFLTSDLFASMLKIDDNPTPTKEDIKLFCKDNLISTIYINIKNSLYIVDANSFKIVAKHNIKKQSGDVVLPFYSLVENITKGVFDWFGEDDIGDYDSYYARVLGVQSAD